MLKLGSTLNLLRQDREALKWFNLARKSSDPQIAAAADRSWRNLRPANERFRLSGWFFPIYSTRWSAAFTYGQVRTELQLAAPIRPYVSVRLIGDSALLAGQPLSEQSVILAIGATTTAWHGARAWFEAGNAIGYRTHHMLPDYRGGLSYARRLARFADTTLDALYISRFDKDVLAYSQSRIGWIGGPIQLYWNANLTVDTHREYWANFVETGPGLRMVLLPNSYVTLNLLRGAYLVNQYNPRPPNFTDLRAGFWYAFSH